MVPEQIASVLVALLAPVVVAVLRRISPVKFGDVWAALFALGVCLGTAYLIIVMGEAKPKDLPTLLGLLFAYATVVHQLLKPILDGIAGRASPPKPVP